MVDGSPMDAVRCLSCGETRWTLFSGTFENLLGEPCQACGGETVVERRRPGTSLRRPPVERRDTAFPIRSRRFVIDRERGGATTGA
jgi:hypothetical protein